jgi:hypothetical protein
VFVPWCKNRKRENLKKLTIFKKVAQTVSKAKRGQNIYNKAQFESPEHLHQTTFGTLKCLQQT